MFLNIMLQGVEVNSGSYCESFPILEIRIIPRLPVSKSEDILTQTKMKFAFYFCLK